MRGEGSRGVGHLSLYVSHKPDGIMRFVFVFGQIFSNSRQPNIRFLTT